ncbi:MAG: hypothetical protein GY790_01140 [Bacteroidetes bacterium]|nr:hypothetical protein [Bacteroidota bacterium]
MKGKTDMRGIVAFGLWLMVLGLVAQKLAELISYNIRMDDLSRERIDYVFVSDDLPVLVTLKNQLS